LQHQENRGASEKWVAAGGMWGYKLQSRCGGCQKPLHCTGKMEVLL